jgi:hypothetical protein
LSRIACSVAGETPVTTVVTLPCPSASAIDVTPELTTTGPLVPFAP